MSRVAAGAEGAFGLPPLDPARYTTLRRIVTDPESRFVLSFGGGAVPGIAGNLALGLLLEQLDLMGEVEEIWGTSAGAIVAGGMASGAEVSEIHAELVELRRQRPIDVAWRQLLAGVALRPFGKALPSGLIRGARLRASIARGLKQSRIEDCPIPVRLIAVRDDGSMRKQIFRRGDLARCMYASMAIPGVFVPQPVEEGATETFFDGGILEKTPLESPIADHQRAGDRRRLVMVATHFDNESSVVYAESFVTRFLQTIYGMEEAVWESQLAAARKREDLTLMLLNPKLSDASLFDFDRIEDNVRSSFTVYADILQNAKLPLTFGVR